MVNRVETARELPRQQHAFLNSSYIGTGASPKQALVDLGFRGVDAANPGIEIIHRGRFKTLTDR